MGHIMFKIIKNGVFSESTYKNFLCMGKIEDLKDTEAYIRPGDIIAFMKSEEAGTSGRHTMMYIGPEKQIKKLKSADIRIAHVTSSNFFDYKTGDCKLNGKSVIGKEKESILNNYWNGGVYNSAYRPYEYKTDEKGNVVANNKIDDLYVIIAKNNEFMASQESNVVQDTLDKKYFDWDEHIK